jgi:hypothetical protein
MRLSPGSQLVKPLPDFVPNHSIPGGPLARFHTGGYPKENGAIYDPNGAINAD